MEKNNSKLRVFEAFAGYGSQRKALENLNINYESVGISEIDGDVILSYAAIHNNLENTPYPIISDEDMYSYLESINVPLHYKTFKNKARTLKGNKLKDLYNANILSKNYGDINVIDPTSLPDFDFLTYSFPCQDISVAGYQKGLDENSGTRSSLLWECCKIIKHKRPKYLLMENVKNLVGKNHIENFNLFLKYLEDLGYTNSWKVLNARDFGIPQNRERVFCISIYKGNKFEFPNGTPLEIKMEDLLEKNVDDKFLLNKCNFTNEPIQQDWIYCLDSNYWKGSSLQGFIDKKRRQLVSVKDKNKNIYYARRLTPLETWRFMGMTDDDFNKVAKYNSNTNLYRQSGNSIVVNVLEAIFKKLFIDYIK